MEWNINKTLVVGPAWVGDMVMAQALYKALLSNSTSAQIHVVAPEWSRPLLQRMPQISVVHSLDVEHGEFGLAKRRRLGRQLRSEVFSQAIVLPRSYKSALVPWFARIPKRIGDVGEFRYGLITNTFESNKDKSIPNVCNYLRYIGIESDVKLVKKQYFPELNTDEDNQAKVLEKNAISNDAPLIACMVGAEYGPSKQWPVEHFSSLVKLLKKQGVNVCLLGSAKDVGVGKQIEQLSGESVFNLCGKTSLLDVIDILAICRVAVSNDSGLMHIAAAVDTPVIAMYGATTPVYTPPLHAEAKVFYVKLECSPCWQRSCQYDHYRCLKDIMPVDVLDAVIKRL
ncbi:MAG: lipopolysaccharide heptosyltransferase II [Gammaproteobacteria bacterium]|nr:lipopolysaccharide heptosyltransferase II [Gammaproteobacteria bacterium]